MVIAIILTIALLLTAFVGMYAIDDYSYTKECEKLEENSYLSQSTFKNTVCNVLGTGLPINFPWTKYPVQYDLKSYCAVYQASLKQHLMRFFGWE